MAFGFYWMTPAVNPGFPAKMIKSSLATQEQQLNDYRKRLDSIHREEKERTRKPPPVEENVTVPQIPPPVPERRVSVMGFEWPLNPFLREENRLSVEENPAPVAEIYPPVVVPADSVPETPVSIMHGLHDISTLHKMFATIPPAMITKIVGHEFKPMDLARLNPRRCWDKFVGGCSLRDYPSLQSLLVPICLYFSVLQAGVSVTSGDVDATRIVGESGLRYTAHLIELEELYQWPAVVQYHMQFHNKRRLEMVHDDYSQWAVGDRDLINRLLVGRQRGRRGGKQLGVPSSGTSARSCPRIF
jgi:hypothetical protein